MRAAAYLRVSTQEQVTEGVSLDMQEEVCRKAALAAGASSVVIFRDEGFTGTNLKRPALQALLSRLGEFDLLVVWKSDRLCRKLRDRLALLDTCVEAGVRFLSATEAIDLDTAMGRLLVHVLGAFAEMEVETLRERVKAALEHRVLVQGNSHGRPPYGYRSAGRGEPWEVSPAEAEVVQRIHARYVAGESVHALLQWLNAEAIPTRHGHEWSFRGLRLILGNPAYCGRNVWHGEALPGKHPAIVAENLMAEVQARLEAAKGMPVRSRAGTLAPILRCGVAGCGGHLRRLTGSKKHAPSGNVGHLYGCMARLRRPQGDRHAWCGTPAPKLEEAVWKSVSWWIGGPFQEACVRAEQRRAAARESESYSRDRECLAEVERKLSANTRAFQIGALTEDLLVKENRALLVERQYLQDRLAATAPVQPPPDLANGVDPDRVVWNLRRSPAELQVAFLRLLFDRIEVEGNSLLFFCGQEVGGSWRVTLPRRWEPGRGIGDNRFLLSVSSALTNVA